MHIHIIMHEAFEGPGAIGQWIEQNGFASSYTRLYNGDNLPNDATAFDALIVLGGPQSPYTTIEECAYFDSAAEQQLIQQAIKHNKKVLGICLGAQLISNALGGQTITSPEKEIGLFPVCLTPKGQKDEFFIGFPAEFDCGHWHGDMPGLTDGAVIIAESKGCPRQIVRFSNNVYAFQCHFEFTPDAIDAMITNCSDELEKDKNKPFVQDAEQLRANDYMPCNKLLFGFLDRFMIQ